MKKIKDIARLRSWCIRKRGDGASVSEICTAARIPRRTFYSWWKRYREHGLEGLEPQSKRPHTIHRTPADTADEILALRRKTGWSCHKLAGYLRTQGTHVGDMTVYRILRSSGLNKPIQTPSVKRTYAKRRLSFCRRGLRARQDCQAKRAKSAPRKNRQGRRDGETGNSSS
jgi:transposase